MHSYSEHSQCMLTIFSVFNKKEKFYSSSADAVVPAQHDKYWARTMVPEKKEQNCLKGSVWKTF